MGAHRLEDRVRRAELVLQILQRARTEHDKVPQRDPVEVTMELAHRRLEEWFAGIFEQGESTQNQVLFAGRMALILTRSNTRYPDLFLSENLPEAYTEQLRNVRVISSPDLLPSNMTAREIDYGLLGSLVGEESQRTKWRPLLRAAGFWAIIYLVSVILYFELP